MEARMDKDLKSLIMDVIMRVSSKMANPKDLASIFGPPESFMKDSGRRE